MAGEQAERIVSVAGVSRSRAPMIRAARAPARRVRSPGARSRRVRVEDFAMVGDGTDGSHRAKAEQSGSSPDLTPVAGRHAPAGWHPVVSHELTTWSGRWPRWNDEVMSFSLPTLRSVEVLGWLGTQRVCVSAQGVGRGGTELSHGLVWWWLVSLVVLLCVGMWGRLVVETLGGAKSISWGKCPNCTRQVGRVRSGEHLRVRSHMVSVGGGLSWQCRGSGRLVCEVWPVGPWGSGCRCTCMGQEGKADHV